MDSVGRSESGMAGIGRRGEGTDLGSLVGQLNASVGGLQSLEQGGRTEPALSDRQLETPNAVETPAAFGRKPTVEENPAVIGR